MSPIELGLTVALIVFVLLRIQNYVRNKREERSRSLRSYAVTRDWIEKECREARALEDSKT